MDIAATIIISILWLGFGVIAGRHINDSAYGGVPLETMGLLLRLLVIITAPVTLLVYERHLFYGRAEPEEGLDDVADAVVP